MLNSFTPVTSHSLAPQLLPAQRLSLYTESLPTPYSDFRKYLSTLLKQIPVRARWKYNSLLPSKNLPKLQNTQSNVHNPQLQTQTALLAEPPEQKSSIKEANCQ